MSARRYSVNIAPVAAPLIALLCFVLLRAAPRSPILYPGPLLPSRPFYINSKIPKPVAPTLKANTEDSMRKAEKDIHPHDDGDHRTKIDLAVDADDIRNCLVDIDVIRSDETLGVDESLFERGLIDSLGITILIAHLEKTYHISVPQDDLLPDNFDTISAIVHYVNSILQDSARE